MSKRCELTGKSPLKGHNVSHAKNKTKRRFLPNLKKVIFKSDILKKNIKLNVTFFKLGKNLLLVLFFAWLTLLPFKGDFPVNSHLLDIIFIGVV